MADTLTCPDCGEEVGSADDVETDEVPEVETNDDGSFDFYGTNDLFLCRNCRTPLGVGRRGAGD